MPVLKLSSTIRWVLALCFWIGSSLAFAEEKPSAHTLTIVFSEQQLSGTLSNIWDQCLVLHTFDGPQAIPVEIIDEVWFSDEKLTGAAAEEWLSNAQEKAQIKNGILEEQGRIAKRAKWLTIISPSIGVARMAMVDNQITGRELVGTTVLDGALLGGMAYGVWGAKRWGVVLPFGVSVIAYRIWAVKNIQIGYSTAYNHRYKSQDSCGLK